MPLQRSRRGNEAEALPDFRPPIRLLTSSATIFSEAGLLLLARGIELRLHGSQRFCGIKGLAADFGDLAAASGQIANPPTASADSGDNKGQHDQREKPHHQFGFEDAAEKGNHCGLSRLKEYQSPAIGRHVPAIKRSI